MKRVSPRAILIGLIAALVAVAATLSTTTPAQAAAASTSTQTATVEQAYKQQAAASGPCTDGNGYTGATLFWRCTGGSATSRFVGSSCNQGEYNAGTNYNVWGAINLCGTRVWLHQFKYPKDQTSGWSICIAPLTATVFSVGETPQNIMVSANTASCQTILP